MHVTHDSLRVGGGQALFCGQGDEITVSSRITGENQLKLICKNFFNDGGHVGTKCTAVAGNHIPPKLLKGSLHATVPQVSCCKEATNIFLMKTQASYALLAQTHQSRWRSQRFKSNEGVGSFGQCQVDGLF